MTTNAIQVPAFVALDGLLLDDAIEMVTACGPHVQGFKIHDLWDQEGSSVVEILKQAGAPQVWVDLKLADTKRTVKYRVEAVVNAGGDMVTIHCNAGPECARTAIKAANHRVSVIGVTLLTSIDEQNAKNLFNAEPQELVERWACLGHEYGLRQFVCSPKEVGMLNQLRKEGILSDSTFITPGVRSPNRETGSGQKRVGTPAGAIQNGASFVVLGGQVTRADNPLDELLKVGDEIKAV